MEQRPLRLGDIVDDYCPRERRITNHVIVALLGETIQQTRCSTCDAEHAFKGARVPSRKKKNEIAALETAVLASVNGTQLVARIERTDLAQAQEITTRQTEDEAAKAPPGARAASHPSDPAEPGAPPAPDGSPDADADRPDEPLPGGWMGHRTLIRASLPRTEGEAPPPRPIPEFTMHQRQPRGAHGFRSGGWNDRAGRGGPRGNFAFGGNGGNPGAERNGNVGGNNSSGGGFGGHHQGGGPGQGNGNGQGRPPGQGKRHRHGKHRRPR
jgi:hypothetical protein